MLVAFSHLRWGFVWQRPQHLLTRFAREMPVVVVEEPVYHLQGADVRVRHDHGVTVVTPLLPWTDEQYGFGNHVNRQISRLVEPFRPPRNGRDSLVLHADGPRRRARDRSSRASPSMTRWTIWPAFARRRPNCACVRRVCSPRWTWCSPVDRRCTGSGGICTRPVYAPLRVKAAHFAPIKASPHEGLAHQRRPILGYYGVIDERLDLDLLAEIADLRPDWTIALIGPVAKIDESTIPVRDNIVRFGQQAYDDLPAFLASFDVALMPFARNEATRAISRPRRWSIWRAANRSFRPRSPT